MSFFTSQRNRFLLSVMAVLFLNSALVTASDKHSATAQKNLKTEAEEHVRKGNAYYWKFDNEHALEEYKTAYDLDPTNFEATLMYLRANNNVGQELQYRHQDLDLAEKIFQKNVQIAEHFVQAHPERAESFFALAMTYGNLALYSSARDRVRLSVNVEKNLKHSIELNPKFPYSYLALGMFYREVAGISFIERFFARLFYGKIPSATYDDAERAFRTSLEFDPKFVFTHFNYAVCLERHGKIAEAITEYQKVMQLPRSDYIDTYLRVAASDALSKLNPKSAADGHSNVLY